MAGLPCGALSLLLCLAWSCDGVQGRWSTAAASDDILRGRMLAAAPAPSAGGPAFVSVDNTCSQNVTFLLGYSYSGVDPLGVCGAGVGGASPGTFCLEGPFTLQPGQASPLGSYASTENTALVVFVLPERVGGQIVADTAPSMPEASTTFCSTFSSGDCPCGSDGCYRVYPVNPGLPQPVTCGGSPPPPAGSPPPPAGGGRGGGNGPPPPSGGGSSTGAIVGGVVGGLAALAAAAALAFFLVRRRQSQQTASSEKGQDSVKSKSAGWSPPGDDKGGTGEGGGGPGSGSPGLGGTTALDTPSVQSGSASLPLTSGSSGSAVAVMAKDEYLSRIVSLTSQMGRRGSGGAARHPGQAPVDAGNWVFDFSDLQMERVLGEGSFGRVYLARWNHTQVACKILVGKDEVMKTDSVASAAAALSLSAKLAASLDEEAGILASLRHPNVLAFLAISYTPPCMLTEYCSRGSLHDVLTAARRDPGLAAQLTWPRLLALALDVSMGMLYLHTRQPAIIHRDLKSPNLFLTAAWRVKVGDFNLSRSVIEDGSKSTSNVALNPRWLAPEVIRGSNPSKASDVFAMGTVMWELLTWKLPWTGYANGWQLVRLLMGGDRLEVPAREALPGPDVPDAASFAAYVELMTACWAEQEAARPSFEDVSAELRSLLEQAQSAAGAGI